ncbi:hypothetical protein VE03_09733 [Pseudogymnoascus sp. 23342-1-I1]|nr:hypothetical protein VE03_09733 [Pseudogymnoascus sp. 23342-1-I1]
MKAQGDQGGTTSETAHVEYENSANLGQIRRDEEDSHHDEKGVDASGDIAAQLVDSVIAGAITPDQEKVVLRRIDCALMPVIFVAMTFQYMDNACLTGAALFGILTDLNLVEISFSGGEPVIDSIRFSYCSLIFYWGYLIGLLPGVYFSQLLPLGKYVSVAMVLWGGVTVCTVAVNSFEGLLVLRFFLGVTEAAIAPAFSLITATWYKSQEQPLRFAIWYSSAGFGTLVGTLLLYAIGQINGPLAAGGISLWLLAVSPLSGRVVAVERMRWEQSGVENKTVKVEQIKEAFTDPKIWFYIIATFLCNFTNGLVTGFESIVVKSFGFSSLRTILLLGGAGAWVFVFLLVGGTISCYIRNTRTLIGMFCCLPVIAGSVMVWQSDDWSVVKDL